MRILFVPAGEVKSGNDLQITDTFYRLFRAHEAWKGGHFDYILVSGGYFRPSTEQTTSAAELMAEYFMRVGVPREKIIFETEAVTSFEMVSLSMKKLEELGLDQAQLTVVTEWLHGLGFYVSLRRGFAKRDTELLVVPRVISRGSRLIAAVVFLYHFFDPLGTSFLHQLVRRRRLARVAA